MWVDDVGRVGRARKGQKGYEQERRVGLPLDTTAAQPKLKLYRYVSPSRPLTVPPFKRLCFPLPLFLNSLSRLLCVYLPFRFSFSLALPALAFQTPFLYLTTLAFPRTYEAL